MASRTILPRGLVRRLNIARDLFHNSSRDLRVDFFFAVAKSTLLTSCRDTYEHTPERTPGERVDARNVYENRVTTYAKIEEMDTGINLPKVPRSRPTKTAYLCVYIRMNGGKSRRPSCLFVFSSRLPFPEMRPAGISSRNIFGWQPLMSTASPKKIRPVGECWSVVPIVYLFPPFFCFKLEGGKRSLLFLGWSTYA